jgi:hypothetical protein
VVAWIDHLPLAAGEKVQALRGYARLPDVGARLAGLRVLLKTGAELTDRRQVCQALGSYCDDGEVTVARAALRGLSLWRWAELPARLPALLKSNHQAVRAWAQRELAAAGWAGLWKAWPGLGTRQRLLVARAAGKAGVDLSEGLREKLLGSERPVRTRAIAMIRELGLAGQLERELIQVSREADATAASGAVMALAGVGGVETQAALEGALEHADARVRSNAIEALRQRMRGAKLRRLREMAHHEANRPQATAIAELMHVEAEGARDQLSRMLRDRRPDYRVSALWAVESQAVLSLAGQVGEMAVSDADRKVRSRAGRVAQGLMQAMTLPPGLEAEAARAA